MSGVRDNPEKNRYEMEVDGSLAIADYRKQPGKILITHVEVPEALRGRGIAAEIMAGVVANVKTRNLTLVPVCPYAVSYLKRHPQ